MLPTCRRRPARPTPRRRPTQVRPGVAPRPLTRCWLLRSALYCGHSAVPAGRPMFVSMGGNGVILDRLILHSNRHPKCFTGLEQVKCRYTKELKYHVPPIPSESKRTNRFLARFSPKWRLAGRDLSASHLQVVEFLETSLLLCVQTVTVLSLSVIQSLNCSDNL